MNNHATQLVQDLSRSLNAESANIKSVKTDCPKCKGKVVNSVARGKLVVSKCLACKHLWSVVV